MTSVFYRHRRREVRASVITLSVMFKFTVDVVGPNFTKLSTITEFVLCVFSFVNLFTQLSNLASLSYFSFSTIFHYFQFTSFKNIILKYLSSFVLSLFKTLFCLFWWICFSFFVVAAVLPIYFFQQHKRTIIIHETTAEGYQRSHTAQWTGRLIKILSWLNWWI